MCDGTFHRLVHAEADRLPGLVIDRYDDVAVLAANTAGMELLTPLIVEALRGLLPLRAIVGRNDSGARKLEGLPEGVTLLHGSDAAAVVVEGGVRFPVDLLTGQKTGWFFDQRGNRDRIAGLAASGAGLAASGAGLAASGAGLAASGAGLAASGAGLAVAEAAEPARQDTPAALAGPGSSAHQARGDAAALTGGARVLDVFCHTGAFGLRCAVAGAAAVLLVDASAPALDLALQAAALNGVADRVTTRRGDAFEIMTALAAEGERFDIVICDPPAFARSRKDAEAGLRAYGRMARLAAAVVAPGGFLFVASCSHHAPLDAWTAQIAFGLHRARREGRILCTSGAGPDHPVHPHLPETAYLKAQLLQLD